MNLPEADRRKITGILGMLASEHDGERASAGLLLTRLLAKHKLRPEELLNGKSNGARDDGMVAALLRENVELKRRIEHDRTSIELLKRDRMELNREIARLQQQAYAAEAPPPRRPSYGPNRGEVAELLARSDVRWTAWEREFLESMTGWRGAPTDRQEETLEKLRAKAKQQDAAHRAAAGIWG